MTLQGFLNLAVQTVTAPRDVARLLLSLNLGREALWTLFALAVVLNALVVGISEVAVDADTTMPINIGPGILALILAVMLAATIGFYTWAGRLLGGSGRIEDVALLLIWLQLLRALVQAAVGILALVSGSLAVIVIIAAMVVGVYIVVVFLDAAHGFDSLAKSFFSVLVGSLAMIVVLTLVFSSLGIVPMGVPADV